MRIGVRLDAETEQMLARLGRITRKTKSAVIRDAIRALGEQSEVKRHTSTVYDRLADVIGIVKLGPGDRARHSEEILSVEVRPIRRRRFEEFRGLFPIARAVPFDEERRLAWTAQTKRLIRKKSTRG